MRSLIRLTDYKRQDIFQIFKIADDLQKGGYENALRGKTIVMFFPMASIRTRIAFEKGIYLSGGQTILFPPEVLEKKEELKDVAGYLNNWADAVIIRHGSIGFIDTISQYSKVPVINAMTDVNHPCEMLSDLYALSKIRKDFTSDNYLFCGGKGNIGLAYKEAADVMNLALFQCCPRGYEIEGLPCYYDIRTAVAGKDIICTDSLPEEEPENLRKYQISMDIMNMANEGAVLNPCPPFYRGEEVSEDVINSSYFVGYEFKKHLLTIQQAILIYHLCL